LGSARGREFVGHPRGKRLHHGATVALVNAKAFLGRKTCFLALSIDDEDFAQLLEHVFAFGREVQDLVDESAPSVGSTIGFDDRVVLGHISRVERVGHQDRRPEVGFADLEQVGQVLAGILAAGVEERDGGAVSDGDDGRSEESCALGVGQLAFLQEFGTTFAHECQDAYEGVVIVDDLSLGRLTGHLVEDGLERRRAFVEDIPLGRRGDRSLQVVLQTLDAVERQTGVVVAQCEHTDGGLVELGSLGLLGHLGRVDLAACIAAQALTVPAQRRQCWLPDDAQNGRRLLEVVELAATAVGTPTSRRETFVSHRGFGRVRVGLDRYATMALGCGGGRAPARGRRLGRCRARTGGRRCAVPAGAVLGPMLIPGRKHSVGLFARGDAEDPTQPRDDCTLSTHHSHHKVDRVDHASHEVEISLVYLGPDSLENALDLSHIDVYDVGLGGLALALGRLALVCLGFDLAIEISLTEMSIPFLNNSNK